jgi:phospholipase C
MIVGFDELAETTESYKDNQRVVGVISTSPAYLMNDGIDGQAIALRGRVPVKVMGPIKKGETLVSTSNGHGKVGDTHNSFAIALETNLSEGSKLIECVIF